MNLLQMHKNPLFLLKNCKKSLRAGDFAPKPPCLWRLGAPPQDLQCPIPHWEFLASG